ncbi:hypothetical protein [Rubellimicrobium aerolatum]|uniref:HEPN domain-containing protein n=1 Tax=Rubellimicrobium aerolatum TaxID=490979 RepID=A0ABW0SH30_9RHOB|nr:hypothetical protein [Rubellimicrobium aerolatum]MBP1807603.1 HEPN domain-containing protein [Rubellimicrobium aerolatum]
MSDFSSGADNPGEEQKRRLSKEMHPWLELFDEELARTDVKIPQRPFHALMMLSKEGIIEVRSGDDKLDIDDIEKNADELWFRIIYSAVEYWYVDRFGAAAMEGHGNPPLEGVISILNTPFLLRLPEHRGKIEVEGETAWMFFEEGIGEGERVESWIVGGPDLKKFDQSTKSTLLSQAEYVASTLRYTAFRRSAANTKDIEVHKIIAATLNYLQQAARGLVSGEPARLGPSWFDLQMANEGALKAVIRLATGEQPKIHDLKKLSNQAEQYGVVLDSDNLVDWPQFSEISDWRYGQGVPLGRDVQYKAYEATLRIVRASMEKIPTSIKPGFGLLLRRLPWTYDK